MSRKASRVIKNTGYLYARMGITMFISLYTTRLILNALGVTDFGIYGIVGSAIGMLSFISSSMAQSTQRFLSFAEGEQNEENIIKVFSNSIFLHVGVAVSVVVLLEIAGFFFFSYVLDIPDHRLFAAKFIYQCSIFATFISILGVPFDAMLNAHENMLYYSVMGVMESLMKLGAAFWVLYAATDKLCFYGLLMAAVTVIITFLTFSYCRGHYQEARTFSFRNKDNLLIKKMGAFAWWNGTSMASWLLFHQGNGIILNHFHGTLYNAAHSVTYQLSGQLGAFGNTAIRALNPVIIKDAGARRYQEMYRSTYLGDRVSFFLISLCNLPVLVNLQPLLKWWLKEVPVYTEVFIYLYFAAVLLESTSMCLPIAIRGVGDIKGYQLTCSLFNIVSPVIIILLFIAHYPPYTIYAVMIASSFLKLCSRVYYAGKVCHFPLRELVINDVLRSVFPLILGLCVSLFVRYHISSGGVIEVGANILFDIIFYSIIYFVIGFGKEDKQYLLTFVKAAITKIKER